MQPLHSFERENILKCSSNSSEISNFKDKRQKCEEARDYDSGRTTVDGGLGVGKWKSFRGPHTTAGLRGV